MLQSRRRLLLLLAAVPVSLLVMGALYAWGMTHLEGEPRGLLRGIEWAAETISTTGYGAEDTWSHPLMVLLVIVAQFLGVFLIFLLFPIYVMPSLEERFEARLPRQVKRMEDHLVVFCYGPAVEGLLEQAARAGLPTLVVESDPALVAKLRDRGQVVLFGELEDDVLSRAHLDGARSLIVNGSDEENAAAVLAARQLGFEGEALALVEDPFHRQPILLAGATGALTPRHVLAAALASRASRRVSPATSEILQIGERLHVREVRIPHGSELAGQTLAKAALGERTGVTVIGQWVGGHLVPQPTAEMQIEAGGILVLVGSPESLERFEKATARAAFRGEGPFLVAGYGEVGRKVVQLLREVGETVKVLDRKEIEGVDLVGNVLDLEILERAAPREVQAVVLALDTDSATLFATVILKDLAPDVPIIARVNRDEYLERIHAAGADFALSISQVSGQILARRLLGEEAISLDPQLKVVRVGSQGLAGARTGDLGIRERTGCSFVAVERGDDLLVDLGSDFRFQDEDAVYICGDGAATQRYLEVFPQA